MIDTGDTAWVLVSAALVLLMTPALGFFYGGFVRRKNALSTIMQSFIIVGVVSVQWVLWGYSLAFGPDMGGIIGSLAWFGLKDVGLEPNPAYAATIPHQAYMVFQMMFAVITPALITGAFAERVKFSTMLVFIVVWATLVYDPVAHWVWAADSLEGPFGWLRAMGALDFAGGTVVHINAGFAALAAALVFRKRLGLGQVAMEPHNVTYIVLGASLLWFGWFGFNAGSAVAASALATSAFVNTHVATAMAAMTWMTLSWFTTGKASVIGAAAGAVAGLVAITPASGYVTPMGALIVGLGAGVLCFLALQFRARIWKVDDSLDVWAVHGIGGLWGALATGLFASAAINTGVGLFYGNPKQLGIQALACLVVMAYTFVGTFIILKVLDMTMGLAVKTEEEEVGLDVSQHGEPAYTLE